MAWLVAAPSASTSSYVCGSSLAVPIILSVKLANSAPLVDPCVPPPVSYPLRRVAGHIETSVVDVENREASLF